MRCPHWLVLILSVGMTCPGAGSAAPAPVGTLQGVVRRDNRPAAYANVSIAGTNVCTQADSLGVFRLADVPIGPRELLFTRFGDSPGRTPVLVHAGLSPLQG